MNIYAHSVLFILFVTAAPFDFRRVFLTQHFRSQCRLCPSIYSAVRDGHLSSEQLELFGAVNESLQTLPTTSSEWFFAFLIHEYALLSTVSYKSCFSLDKAWIMSLATFIHINLSDILFNAACYQKAENWPKERSNLFRELNINCLIISNVVRQQKFKIFWNLTAVRQYEVIFCNNFSAFEVKII